MADGLIMAVPYPGERSWINVQHNSHLQADLDMSSDHTAEVLRTWCHWDATPWGTTLAHLQEDLKCQALSKEKIDILHKTEYIDKEPDFPWIVHVLKRQLC